MPRRDRARRPDRAIARPLTDSPGTGKSDRPNRRISLCRQEVEVIMKALQLCTLVLLASASAITCTFAQVAVPSPGATYDTGTAGTGTFGRGTSGVGTSGYGPGAYGPGAYGPGGYGPGAFGPGGYGPGAYRDLGPAISGSGGFSGVPIGGGAPASPRL